jgi:hypothetical protein
MIVEPTGAIEERVVDLCNRLAEGLGVDVEQIGAEPFVAILTGALQASGLRLAVYDNPGGADGSGD